MCNQNNVVSWISWVSNHFLAHTLLLKRVYKEGSEFELQVNYIEIAFAINCNDRNWSEVVDNVKRKLISCGNKNFLSCNLVGFRMLTVEPEHLRKRLQINSLNLFFMFKLKNLLASLNYQLENSHQRPLLREFKCSALRFTIKNFFVFFWFHQEKIRRKLNHSKIYILIETKCLPKHFHSEKSTWPIRTTVILNLTEELLFARFCNVTEKLLERCKIDTNFERPMNHLYRWEAEESFFLRNSFDDS